MKNENRTIEYAKKPKAGHKFCVDLQSIDVEKIEKMPCKVYYEGIKKVVLYALKLAQVMPAKYGNRFYTYIPYLEELEFDDFKFEVVSQLVEFGSKIGDHCADWIEQGLEWAQRIQNGEDFVSLCEIQDAIEYSRIVVFDDDMLWNVGGGGNDVHSYCVPPADVVPTRYDTTLDKIRYVPLVVGYEDEDK